MTVLYAFLCFIFLALGFGCGLYYSNKIDNEKEEMVDNYNCHPEIDFKSMAIQLTLFFKSTELAAVHVDLILKQGLYFSLPKSYIDYYLKVQEELQHK